MPQNNSEWKQIGSFLLELGVSRDTLGEALKACVADRDKGVHTPVGRMLVSRYSVPQETVVEAVRRLEAYRLSHLDPITQFSPSTKFGERLYTNPMAKKLVAACAARRFIRPGGCVFLADGTSGFYTFLSLARDVAKDEPVTVFTNSLGAVMEHSQSELISDRVKLRLVGKEPLTSKVRNEYLALGGERSNKQIRKACRGITAVLPVSGMSYHHGPSAADDRIRRIKMAIMESAARVVFLADGEKIGAKNGPQHTVFESASSWEKWTKETPWHLITSIFPNTTIKYVVAGKELDTYSAAGGRIPAKGSEDYEAEVKQFYGLNQKSAHDKPTFYEITMSDG